ncbi:GNAT family N-acetyltransferase [Planosporangium thailandense]|uniref:GNAT family N-acetyltransferase n=1 Tax=Planosporangium thailandense TaxID=765197 RepID=A0ABX0XZT2_9ACTN|nr:GNAT family N-acetyltransferase [Planosporangium thailandense]NJC71407.1 GNAT family N-acetyltransferase [Planosporangium thailandense]
MTTIPSTVTIRRATRADAATVATLVGEIAAHEDQQAHVHVTEARWRTLLDRPDVVVLVAERDGRAAGYVSAVRQLHLWTGGDVLALDDLYVRSGCRDAGIGRQLMAALAALALPEQLLIRWGMEVDNVDAQRFYRRLGATLRHKVLAAWAPTAYAGMVAGSDQRGPAPQESGSHVGPADRRS